MADNPGKPSASGDTSNGDDRLAALETLLNENEALRRKTRILSLFGLLIVLVLFTLMAFRLYGHFKHAYYDRVQTDSTQFMQTMLYQADAKGIEAIMLEEYGKVHAQLTRDKGTLETFKNKFRDELEAQLPAIENELEAITKRIQVHAETNVRDKLNAALDDAFAKALADLEANSPDLADRDIDAHLEKAREHFMERLDEVLNERIGQVAGSVESVQAAAEKLRTSGVVENIHTFSEEDLASMCVDALVDLIVYELRPDLAAAPFQSVKLPARQSKGGDK